MVANKARAEGRSAEPRSLQTSPDKCPSAPVHGHSGLVGGMEQALWMGKMTSSSDLRPSPTQPHYTTESHRCFNVRLINKLDAQGPR